MTRVLGFSLLLTGIAGHALAGQVPTAVPEIGASAAVGALALLAGGMLILRSRRK